MGLSLEVGILADLRDNDPGGEAAFRDSFEVLNRYLASIGMPAHREPSACEVWSADMIGYSGLHYLRRLAAHVDATATLPPPGDDTSPEDPILDAYFADVDGRRQGLLAGLFGRRRRFARQYDHLLVHGDSEGFYLPADFPRVLVPPREFPVPGGMVGSAPRLLEELTRLASLLAIPETVGPASEPLWEAVESQGEGEATWERFGIESHACVVLREGCRRCIASGAALVFT